MIVSVWKGPIQPVAMEGQENSAPVAGAVILVERVDGSGSSRITTGAEGRITANFRPGAYAVTVEECPGAMVLPEPVGAVVISGGFALVRFDCDTGIR